MSCSTRWTRTRCASSKLKNRPASLREKIVDGKFRVDQGSHRRLPGSLYQNIVRAAQILDGRAIGSGEFWLSVYPTSQPVNLELTRRATLLPHSRRRLHPLLLLRPLLRRGRRARQRGFLHPSLHP